MDIARKLVSGLVSVGALLTQQAQAAGACDLPGLTHQQKDTATIQQL